MFNRGFFEMSKVSKERSVEERGVNKLFIKD